MPSRSPARPTSWSPSSASPPTWKARSRPWISPASRAGNCTSLDLPKQRAGAARGGEGVRQAPRGRDHERQRHRRELGEVGARQRDRAGLVSRRGRRTAIAETLAGDNNPVYDILITVYKGVEQLPEFADYSMARRTYRYFDGEPLFPFGYGLKLLSLSGYSGIETLQLTLQAGGCSRSKPRSPDTSGREGDEVVQLYLRSRKLPGRRRGRCVASACPPAAGGKQDRALRRVCSHVSHVNEAGVRLVGAAVMAPPSAEASRVSGAPGSCRRVRGARRATAAALTLRPRATRYQSCWATPGQWSNAMSRARSCRMRLAGAAGVMLGGRDPVSAVPRGRRAGARRVGHAEASTSSSAG